MSDPTHPFTTAAGEGRAEFFVRHPLEEVFMLFGAEAEASWAPGWRPRWIYPTEEQARSALQQQGWVFTTSPGTPDERVWYVERFDLERHEAVYLVHWPRHLIYRIEVASFAEGGGTRTRVVYSFRGLSSQGNAEVAARTDPAAFAAEIRSWGELISRSFDARTELARA